MNWRLKTFLCHATINHETKEEEIWENSCSVVNTNYKGHFVFWLFLNHENVQSSRPNESSDKKNPAQRGKKKSRNCISIFVVSQFQRNLNLLRKKGKHTHKERRINNTSLMLKGKNPKHFLFCFFSLRLIESFFFILFQNLLFF